MTRRRGARHWAAQHAADPYVRRAREAGLRSRAAWKLEEMDRRDRLLRPGMTVVDLGAAPGGWSQYAARRLAGRGEVWALDRLPMAPVPNVHVIQGDFTDPGVVADLRGRLGSGADLVMSDMAPNITGVPATDQARALALAEQAAAFAAQVLRPGGAFLVKVFEGPGLEALRRGLQDQYRGLRVRKPGASRARSREYYLLATGFRGPRCQPSPGLLQSD